MFVVKKYFLHIALCATTCLLLLNHGHLNATTSASTQEKIIIVEIKKGELDESPKVITAFEGTALTLLIKSDEALVLHLHGYDIITKVEQAGKTLMKLNTFATGRFPIKIHTPAHEHQGNSHHERTLLYLEVYPN